MSCNMAHRATFNATFRCGNILQVLKVLKKLATCIVARILHVALKIVSCNIALPTVAARKFRTVAARKSCNMD